MSLYERLAEHVRAAFPAVYVQSHEHEDALAEIARLCRDQHWSLACWDVDRGLRAGGGGQSSSEADNAAAAADPVAAVKAVNAMATPDGTALLVLVNFHRYLHSAEVAQAVANQAALGKQNRTVLVVLAPVVQLPAELEKLFVLIEHDLPTRDQLLEIARGVATEPGEMPDGDQALAGLLDASAGLTRWQAENAFSLSLVRHGRLSPPVMWELKAQSLKASGLLALHRGGEAFGDLGGLDALKGFCAKALSSRHQQLAKPRGILLLGVPGTGKSAFAKALGNETGRPTLVLDVGSLMGSLVGATEANTRAALRIADAMSPCVLYCDELEKALSGAAASGGATDSGVSSRLFGSLLSWLSDHESDVFFVATSNDVSKLPPEFARSERFDGVWFLDLPAAAERRRIWQMYLRKYQIPAEQQWPKDEGWTGAEIRSCCRLACLLRVPLAEAATHVVPVSATAAESVQRLRAWAAGRCLDATRGGIYSRAAAGAEPRATPPARKVSRPSSN
jgi:hypothetical protein